MKLNDNIGTIPGIGSYYESRLKKLEIYSIEDLLYHLPFRYMDYSLITSINLLQAGEIVTIRGKVESIKNHYLRRNLTLQKAVVTDNTGTISITWFNQPYLESALNDKIISVSGKVTRFGKQLTLESPDFEIYKNTPTIHTGRLIPIYPTTSGLNSKWLRNKINFVLKNCQIDDPIPIDMTSGNGYLNLKEAYNLVHQPVDIKTSEAARKRLAFDELFYLQLASMIIKKRQEQTKVKFKLEIEKFLSKLNNVIDTLPFTLTDSQYTVLKEIENDLIKNHPMNRLLQGDVGSGKTVVAGLAAYLTYLNGYKVIFIAPTEILAGQHFRTLKKILPKNIKIELQTSSKKLKNKYFDIIIGTHALLYNQRFENTALVIIDEQHRFGVSQRSHLIEISSNPHLLTMTATPIPRTIALSLYGDLDISVINQMPKGRQTTKTYVVKPEKYDAAFNWIKDKISKGKLAKNPEQAFIIYPFIEESEVLTEVKAATKEYERLKNGIFRNLKCSLLHGRISACEKDRIIQKFRSNEIDILVSTTVVEVGMDIPNATIMLIENADRFGLAQLHQLRGRVGRNDKVSYCLLFTQKDSSRLKAMEKYSSGMKLAEIDLTRRGAGEIFGIKQHGIISFKAAELSDIETINDARNNAQKLIKNHFSSKKYPKLYEKIKKKLDYKVKLN